MVRDTVSYLVRPGPPRLRRLRALLRRLPRQPRVRHRRRTRRARGRRRRGRAVRHQRRHAARPGPGRRPPWSSPTPAPGSASTPRTTPAAPSPTPWPRSTPAPPTCSAPPTATASGSATPTSSRSSPPWSSSTAAGCCPRARSREMTRISHAIAEVVNLRPSTHQPYVGVSAFAHKAGLHASAIKVDPDLYQHIDPELVGNTMRMLVSDMAGRASIELKGKELGIDLGGDRELVGRVVERVKERELQGYTYEAADASFELLLRARGRGPAARTFFAWSPGAPSSRTAPTAPTPTRPRSSSGPRASASSPPPRATARSTPSTAPCASRLEQIYPQLGQAGAGRLQGPHPGGHARHGLHDPRADHHHRRRRRVVHGRGRRRTSSPRPGRRWRTPTPTGCCGPA